jgi:hypothetical protein
MKGKRRAFQRAGLLHEEPAFGVIDCISDTMRRARRSGMAIAFSR